ncbi:AAA family ATPase [Candidatus Acetothermia bacterium]|nr:AAA family ATPase [Candidatus Acetothermia bacterium]
MTLRIYTLGAFRVYRGETLLSDAEWKASKNKALLKILLTHHGHALTKDQLIEWLWPDAEPSAASRDLRVTVSRTRKLLDVSMTQRSSSSFILTTESGYAWNTQSPYWLDAQQFETLCAQSERDPSLVERAIALYLGDYLEEDRYADWAAAKREELREMYLVLLTRMAELQAKQGRYQRAIQLCREILARDHCRESSYRQLMLYYYLSGKQTQALRAYEQCVNTLQQQLHVEPSPEIQQLHEQIRTRHIPEIDKVYPIVSPERLQIPYTLSPGSVPFVGRQAERERLLHSFDQAREGHGQCLLVSGEAGVGKTRLVQELMSEAQKRSDALVFQGHSQELGIAYQPWAEIVRDSLQILKLRDLRRLSPSYLTEVAKIAPTLRARVPDLTENPPLAPQQEQHRFFESLVQFFLELIKKNGGAHGHARVLTLFLDDLHWADAASMDFLSYFLSQIALPRLTPTDVAKLLKKMPFALHHRESLGGKLYRETAGNPLFLIATLQHLFEEGILRVENESWVTDTEDDSPLSNELKIPPTIKELIVSRLARLGEKEDKLLRLASVLGREIVPPLLGQAGENSEEECWIALSQLTEAGFIVEDQGHYAFSHDKIREVVYEEIAPARRQFLHQRVVWALEQRYADRLEEWTGLLAQHAFRAGVWRLEKGCRLCLASSAESRERISSP